VAVLVTFKADFSLIIFILPKQYHKYLLAILVLNPVVNTNIFANLIRLCGGSLIPPYHQVMTVMLALIRHRYWISKWAKSITWHSVAPMK